MELGGLMSQAFKIILGNPDNLAVIITWSVFISILFATIGVYRLVKDE